MALSHILHAITAEADAEIRTLQKKHDDTVHALDSDHATALTNIRQGIAQKKSERLRSLRTRAEGHVNMKKRHAILRRKQEILDALYADVSKSLTTLPPATIEKMITLWVQNLPCAGVIRPSVLHEAFLKKVCGSKHTVSAPVAHISGGFLFESEKIDRDYSFEFLVRELLRPATEINSAHQLFGV